MANKNPHAMNVSRHQPQFFGIVRLERVEENLISPFFSQERLNGNYYRKFFQEELLYYCYLDDQNILYSTLFQHILV